MHIGVFYTSFNSKRALLYVNALFLLNNFFLTNILHFSYLNLTTRLFEHVEMKIYGKHILMAREAIMTTFKTTKILMTCAAVALLASPAMANDLIDNRSFGYVDGNITQVSRGFLNELTLDVGSISTTDDWGMAMQNTADGYIGGEVYQEVNGDDLKATIEVGSIKALDAQNNNARGAVNGSIMQRVDTFNGPTPLPGAELAEVRVGSISAENGFAFNNNADGTVNGDITQEAFGGSKTTVRVGSQHTN